MSDSAGKIIAIAQSVLNGIAPETIEEKVDAWLDENITNPDSPPLDRSLSSSSSAAPADMVGDLKSAFTTQSIIPVLSVENGFYKTSDGTYSTLNSYRTTEYISVIPGEYYIMRNLASSAAYAIAMFDSSKNLVTAKSIAGTGGYQELVFKIPSGISYIKFSGSYDYRSYWSLSKSTNTDRIDAGMDLLETYIDMIGYGAEYQPTLSYSNGAIVASNGSTNTVNTYKNSNFIPVTPGMKYSIKSNTSESILMLGMYATNSGNADTTKSVVGTGELTTKTGSIPSGINYVKVCSTTADLSSVVFKLYATNCIDLENKNIENEIRFGQSYSPALEWGAGYIKSSDGTWITAGAMSCTQMVSVNPGQIIHITTYGSSSILYVASYVNSTDGTAQLLKSIKGKDTEVLETIDGIVPIGINYVRFCCYNNHLSDFTVTISNPSYEHNEQRILDNTSKKINNPYIYARRPVIGFILDKDFEHNGDMHDVFVDHDAPFGVALSYNTDTFKNVSLPEYLYWAEYEKFEMLTHGSYALPTTGTYTDEQVIGFINDSYDTLVGYGFDPKGYIAGAGLMADHYVPFVMNKYDWASTLANHSATDESCIIFGTDHPYKLWRYSMQMSTLAQMKDAVDRAISENALLLFYGHAQKNQLQNFTTENLDALLDYIESKDVTILKPSDAVESYFSIRYDDLYPQT